MSQVAATLGNDSRLILLRHISAGEKSVEMLCELSGLPVASASQHLQVLKKSNMVATRRAGKRVLYRLQNGPVRELLDALERFAVFSGLHKEGDALAAPMDAQSLIDQKQLAKKMKRGDVTLLDVRSRDEYRKGHITGAINIPYDELETHLKKLPKDREVIAYCRGPLCVLSVNAVALLKAKGISATRLESGFSDWSGDSQSA